MSCYRWLIATSNGWSAINDSETGIDQTDARTLKLANHIESSGGLYAVGACWMAMDIKEIEDAFSALFASEDLYFSETLPEGWVNA